MTAAASILTDFWNDQLVEHERQYLFLVLVGFVLSFGFIRLSTRLMRSPRVPWWPGSIVSDGGVHLHHLVFGIVLMIASGAIGFAGFSSSSPLYEICAVTFGIGAGLTIDEFALWVYLDDVYWSRQGRTSIDATVIVVAVLGLALLGIRPFELDTESTVAAVISVLLTVLVFACILICIGKGRILHGVVGLFVQVLPLWGASRLAKPSSPWARRFYGERNPQKQELAERRFRPDRPTERLKEALRDAIGGAPEDEYQAKLAAREQGSSTVTEVRARADSLAGDEAAQRAPEHR